MKPRINVLSPVIFRTPVCDLEQLTNLFDDLQQKPIVEVLTDFFQTSTLRKALYLASPSLFKQMEIAQAQNGSLSQSSLHQPLLKYALRACSRSTPFGLFAGISIGQLGEETTVRFAEDRLVPFTRLDSSALVQMSNRLLESKSIRDKITYRLNDSCYQVGEEVRYSEFIDSLEAREVQISSLFNDTVLQEISKINRGFTSYSGLVSIIREVSNASDPEIEEYLDELIRIKFLISELEPGVTGKPFIDSLRSFNVSHPFDELEQLIRHSESNSPDKNLNGAIAFDDWLNEIGFQTEHQRSFWQTDLSFRTTRSTVSSLISHQIARQIEECSSVLVNQTPGWISLFKGQFSERYGEQWVPLLQVLDNDQGIGLRQSIEFVANPAPILTSILSQQNSQNGISFETDIVSTLRETLYRKAIRTRQLSIRLNQIDFPGTAVNLPQISAIWGTLLGSENGTPQPDRFTFFLNSVLSNPTAILGRFCQDNSQLTDIVRRIHQLEDAANPEIIHAEVVHLAGSRSGNVNIRPTLRKYEIPYLTPPSVEEDYIIELTDLLVSVRGNRIRLFSRKLNKEIIPRLTTAHNVRQGDEVYQFLVGLNYQENQGGKWDWKQFRDSTFLPRIEYKNLVLARAQWTLLRADLVDLTTKSWKDLKHQLLIPNRVLMRDGDNELPLQLNLEICQQILLDELKLRGKVTLVEWIFDTTNQWIQDEHGYGYAHELLLFGHQQVKYDSPKFPVIPPLDQTREVFVERSFPPGTAWVYSKIYTGHDQADNILCTILLPFLNDQLESKLCTHWFYVRYYDPQFHIRLRIHSPDPVKQQQLVVKLNELWSQHFSEQIFYKIQYDTYDREIERYGSGSIELCEAYFHVDSTAILSFLSEFPHCGESGRIHFAIANAIRMVQDFNLSQAEILNLFKERQQSYWREFGSSKTIRDQLNKTYRQWHETMEGFFRPNGNAEETDLQLYQSILDQRSLLSQPLVASLQNLNLTTPSIPTLVSSLLHMSLDRLFLSQVRAYELITYHFLCRFYESYFARASAAPSTFPVT